MFDKITAAAQRGITAFRALSIGKKVLTITLAVFALILVTHPSLILAIIAVTFPLAIIATPFVIGYLVIKKGVQKGKEAYQGAQSGQDDVQQPEAVQEFQWPPAGPQDPNWRAEYDQQPVWPSADQR